MKKLVERCLIIIFTFFPTLIILERYVPYLSTLLTGLVVVCGLTIIIASSKKFALIKYVVIFLCYNYSLKYVTDIGLHKSNLILFVFTMIVYDLCRNRQYISTLISNLYDKCELIEIQLWICLIINILFIFIPYGYSNSYSQMWSLNAYQGIYIDPHQLGYRLCAMIVLLNIIILLKNKSRYVFLLIGFEALILISGARVPMVMAFALGLLSIKLMDIKIVNRSSVTFSRMQKIIILVISVSMFAGALIAVSQTSFVKKMQVTLEAKSFDSGRSNLIDIDIEYYKNTNLDMQLFGSGTEKTYKLHKEKAYAEIWSHNDFLQILVGSGLITLVIYTISIIKVLFVFLKKNHWIYWIIGLSMVFLAWGNGLYIHPRFVCVIPLIIATIDDFEKMKYLESMT